MKLKLISFGILIMIFLLIIDIGVFNDNNYIYELICKKVTNILNNIYDKPIDKVNVNENIIYQKKPNIITTNPLVYIYNTHENETYSNVGYSDINIKPSVKDASFLLQKYLKEINIETVVEENIFMEMLIANNWTYDSLYKVSRFYLENAIKRYEDVELYIDLHRDSIKKNESTIEIAEEKYAKILFVVGISHDKYEENLKIAQTLNEIITDKYGISRGILKKAANNANGIYNQDLKSNIVLIEVGGYQNNYDEVDNTLKVIADAIKEYIEDNND